MPHKEHIREMIVARYSVLASEEANTAVSLRENVIISLKLIFPEEKSPLLKLSLKYAESCFASFTSTDIAEFFKYLSSQLSSVKNNLIDLSSHHKNDKPLTDEIEMLTEIIAQIEN